MKAARASDEFGRQRRSMSCFFFRCICPLIVECDSGQCGGSREEAVRALGALVLLLLLRGADAPDGGGEGTVVE